MKKEVQNEKQNHINIFDSLKKSLEDLKREIQNEKQNNSRNINEMKGSIVTKDITNIHFNLIFLIYFLI